MIVNSVNKTGLHPGGVAPHIEHTELEEELHEKAHIDYDTVAIVSTIDSNTTFAPSSPVLFVRSPTPQLLPFTKMR
jgi:hypothetical protein